MTVNVGHQQWRVILVLEDVFEAKISLFKMRGTSEGIERRSDIVSIQQGERRVCSMLQSVMTSWCSTPRTARESFKEETEISDLTTLV